MDRIFSKYIREIQKMEDANAPETGYYYSLKTLLMEFSKKYLKKDIIVIQQEGHPFGKPDFTIKDDKGELIGIIECKRPNINLIKEENHKKKGKQIKRYRRGANNFIFTNFYDLKLYNDNKIEQKISLLDGDKNIKNTGERDIIEILTNFLSNSKDRYESEDFVIQGKGLTEKQIERLKNNKKVSMNRGGWEYTVMETSTEVPEYDVNKDEYTVGGKRLTKKQINHLEYYGSIIITCNNIRYIIETLPGCYYDDEN